MNCLKNNIGLRGICDYKPNSGKYANDIPGFSSKVVSALTPSDVLNFKEFFIQQERIAGEKVCTDVLRCLRNHKDFGEIRDRQQVGSYGSNYREVISPLGFYIQGNQDKPEERICINWIRFWADREGVIEIEYLDTGCEEPFAYKVKCGENYIPINKVLQSCEAWIRINFCDVQVGLECPKDNCNCDSCCKCNCKSSCVTIDTISGVNEGIQMGVTCIVDPSYLICDYVHLFGELHLMALAICMSHEWKTTTNCSYLADGGQSIADHWLLLYEGGEDYKTGKKYKPNYEIELKQICKTITGNLDAYECRGRTVQTYLP